MKTPIKNQSSTTGTHTPAGRPAVKQAVFHVEQLTRREYVRQMRLIAAVLNSSHKRMFEAVCANDSQSAHTISQYADGLYYALRTLTGAPRVSCYDTFEALLAVIPSYYGVK